jgi:hypothetical protein
MSCLNRLGGIAADSARSHLGGAKLCPLCGCAGCAHGLDFGQFFGIIAGVF